MEKSSLIRIKNLDDFNSACNYCGIELNNNQLDLFKKYHKILLEWNEKINVISRKEENILERHFLDSILFLPEIENLCKYWSQPAPTGNVLDIGSGGGFPAIPLAIMKPDWRFILCESIKKKTIFLTHLVKELALKNTQIQNVRVEMLHTTSLHSDNKFNLVTARAVAKLDVLIKYALPLLKKGGYLIAYKAKEIDEEVRNTERTIKKNNLELKIVSKELNTIERKLIVVKK